MFAVVHHTCPVRPWRGVIMWYHYNAVVRAILVMGFVYQGDIKEASAYTWVFSEQERNRSQPSSGLLTH